MATDKNNASGQTEWHLIDANERVLGRIANETAQLLMGKHRSDFAPNIALPVHVVIINTDKVAVTGNKLEDKMYYRHTGYPGGLKSRSLGEQMKRDSRWVVEQAVSGMLPKNNLRAKRLLHLKLYAGEKHPHEAQFGGNVSEIKN